ncbi:MAG: hypothetical protein ACO3IN_11980 [Steroidobacteraceae bacterium]
MKAVIVFLLASLPVQAGLAEVTAIRGARIHTGLDGEVIENGTLLIRDGVITAVGTDLAVPAEARLIEAAGSEITPGLVDGYGRLGVEEVSGESTSVDATHTGLPYSAAFDLTPAINPHSVRIQVNRSEGITAGIVAPGVRGDGKVMGPLFAGQAALLHLLPGDRAETRPGIGVVFPYGTAGAGLSGGSRAAAVLRLREALADGRDYRDNRRAFERGERRDYALTRLDLEALQPVLDGRAPLLVEANREADLRTVIELARSENIRVVIVGGAEAWRAAELLAAENVPVIIDALANLPENFDALDATLANAARLERAGVKVAFATSDRTNPRNVRQLAGNAVRHGMSHAAAVAAITTVPLGTFAPAGTPLGLQAGARADLVIWDGDPLEVSTLPTEVFLSGVAVGTSSRQTLLRDRYRQLGAQPPAYSGR